VAEGARINQRDDFGFFCAEDVGEVVPGTGGSQGMQTVPSQLNLSTFVVV